jgi:hypothetical protein
VPYASLDDPQSLSLYGYVGNNPLSRADADGHEWPTWTQAGDFAVGAVKGYLASATWGLAPGTAPSSSDSNASLLGQATGTALEGAQGTMMMGAGSGAVDLGVDLAAPTATASLIVSAVGAVAAGVGTVAAGGALKNGNDVAKAMSKRAGDFSASTREGAIKDNATKNGGTNKCEKCGQDLQRVGNKSGQKPPDNQLHVHHDPPINKGGGKDSKPVVVCRDCHLNDIHKQ